MGPLENSFEIAAIDATGFRLSRSSLVMNSLPGPEIRLPSTNS